MALLHEYLNPLCSKDRQLISFIDKVLCSRLFSQKSDSLCNKAVANCRRLEVTHGQLQDLRDQVLLAQLNHLDSDSDMGLL